VVFGGLRVFAKSRGSQGVPSIAASSSAPRLVPKSAAVWTSCTFVVLLTAGAFFIGESINQVVSLVLGGTEVLPFLMLSLAGLSLTVLGTLYFLYRLDLGSGAIRRRVRAFETGWKE